MSGRPSATGSPEENQKETGNTLPVLVLDTAALTAGYAPARAVNLTTRKVVDELRNFGVDWQSNPLSLIVQVSEPAEDSLKKVSEAAGRSGDLALLSGTDVSLLALAFEQRSCSPTVVTDDYAVANVCEWLGLRHAPATLTKPSFRKMKWIWYCPRCSRVYRNGEKICETCGVTLRRKAGR
ncbi:MAG: hypothetical protein QW767_04395 [Thermoprotei archaeon]